MYARMSHLGKLIFHLNFLTYWCLLYVHNLFISPNIKTVLKINNSDNLQIQKYKNNICFSKIRSKYVYIISNPKDLKLIYEYKDFKYCDILYLCLDLPV